MEHTRRYYERRLRKHVGSAIQDFAMVRDGDSIMAAISGGKDSIVMLKILNDLRLAAPVSFEIRPIHVATGFEENFDQIAAWSKKELHLEIEIIDSDLARILNEIRDPAKSACALCSRLRRGILYAQAQDTGANAIALGHHRDDIVETFLLRSFYTGQLGAMAPSRISNDGRNRIIRPLAYCPETLISEYFEHLEVAPVENRCLIRADSKRDMIKKYLKELENDIPDIRSSIFAALGNIDRRSLCIREE